jgi:hypothetical protein
MHAIRRLKRYYIDLYATNPCVTFVHPCDGAPNGAQQATPIPMAESTSSSSSKTSLRRAQTRLGVRPAGSRDPIGRGSSRGQRPTDAQQLYLSSSLKQEPKVAVSPPTLSRRPSLSSIYTGSSSSVSEEAIVADQPSILPAVHPNASAQNFYAVSLNSTTTSSPSPPPNHFPRASHDHRKVFDYTQLSCEARNVTGQAPYPGPGQPQSFASLPLASSPSGHILPSNSFASLPLASSPSGHILPSNIVRRSTTHKHYFSADSIGRRNGSDQISSDVHAMYPSQARFLPKNLRPSQPPANATRQPSIRHSSYNNNVTTAAPGKQDRQTPKQIPFDIQDYLDILKSPTVTTEDKDPSPTSMFDAPNGRSLASADTSFAIPAPSQPVAPTQTILPEIQTSYFNTQYQDLSGAFQTQANLTRRLTIASFPIAEQQQHQGQSSSTQMEDWMLQQPQPRPLRPLRAVPANMNVQVQASRNAESNEGSENERSHNRKSSTRSRLSLFGLRTKTVS